MYHSSVLFIALRYIRGTTISSFNKYIRWISSISVMLGTMILIIVLSVMNGFEYDVKQNLFRFIPHTLLTNIQGYVSDGCIPPDSIIYDLGSDLVHMEPLVISNTVILQSATKIALGVMLGVKPNQYEPLFNYLINKRINLLKSDKYYIIIGLELAKKLEVHINDQVRLIIPSVVRITPMGCIPSQRVFTILDIYFTHNMIDTYQVLINQTDAAKLMCYPPQCVTGWRLWLRDPIKSSNRLNQLNLVSNWVFKNWGQYNNSLFQAIKIEKNIMFLLLGLIIVAAGFNIIAFLGLLIMDKQKETAILRICGLSRCQSVLLFMIQGVWHGMFGIILGAGLGVLISYKFNQILSCVKIFSTIPVFPIDIRLSQIFIVISMTFVLICLAALYPSWRSTSMYTVKVLYHG